MSIENKKITDEQLENVTGGVLINVNFWRYSFEYDFAPDFANVQFESDCGFASEEEAKFAMEDKIASLANGTKGNPCSRDVYVRNKQTFSYIFTEF